MRKSEKDEDRKIKERRKIRNTGKAIEDMKKRMEK